MDRHSLLRTLPDVVSWPLGAMIASLASVQVAETTLDDPVLEILIFVAVTMVCGSAIQLTLKHAIAESSAVRRLLLGPSYVEGQWLLRVQKHTARGVAEFHPTDLGLLSVRYGERGYFVEMHFQSRGRAHKGDLRAKHLPLADQEFNCAFSGRWIATDEPYQIDGIGRIAFRSFAGGQPPRSCTVELANVGAAERQTVLQGTKPRVKRSVQRKIMTPGEQISALLAAEDGTGRDAHQRPPTPAASTALMARIAQRSEMTTVEKLSQIHDLLVDVVARDVAGAVVELGCHEGWTAAFLQTALAEMHSDKELHVFDSFQGLPAPGPNDKHCQEGDQATSMQRLRATFDEMQVQMPEVHAGFFDQTLARQLPDVIAFAFVDCDLQAPTHFCLDEVYRRLAPGAIVCVDDYRDHVEHPGVDAGYLGVTVATDEFLRSKPEKKAVPFVGHQRDVALGWFRKL